MSGDAILDGGEPRRMLFLHPVLCQLGLPRSELPHHQREFRRVSGKMTLTIQAGMVRRDGVDCSLPVPFGSRARLALMHITTAAIRSKSPHIQPTRFTHLGE